MNEPLEAEVVAALDQFGMRARSWQCLSTIRAAEYERRVYRLDLKGGRVLKARRLEDEATARRLFEIRQMAPAGFAPVLHCHGAVMLEAWIEGEELAQRPATTRHLIEAATLLACLHATPHVSGRRLPATQSTAAEREMAEQARWRLAADGRLALAECDGIGTALQQLDPKQALLGLVHTDFCGENMVIDPDGRLHIIDNERMDLGALGLDVARTWYRWTLPPPAWECFRANYQARMPYEDTLRHFAFWALVATLKSAILLLRLDPARAHVPIERLRQIMAEFVQVELMSLGNAERGRGWRN
jgi:aminoglycoside phosphotransferase (APT) family kinase protein